MILALAAFLIGIVCVVLSYLLLVRGLYAGETSGSVWSNRALLFKRSVPGALFGVFGAGVIVAGLVHAHHLRRLEQLPNLNAPSAQQAEPAKPSAPAVATQTPHRARKHTDEHKPATTPAQRVAPAATQAEPAAPATTVPSAKNFSKPGRA
jgi:hypothetical protein